MFTFFKKPLNFGPDRGFVVLTAILTLINFYALKSSFLGLFLFIFWIIGLMPALWGRFLNLAEENWPQKALGLIFSLALIIDLSAVWLYAGRLKATEIVIVFLFLNLILFLIWPAKQRLVWKVDFFKQDGGKKQPVLILLLWLVLWALLFAAQTSQSILTPWAVVPKFFFVVYAALVATSLLYLWPDSKADSKLSNKIIILSLVYFAALSVSWAVYKIGFGFDAFVHQAAEIKLSQLGYILPRPLYYGGQYALIVFLAKIFMLPIRQLDKLLVPAMAAISLPSLLYLELKRQIKAKKIQWPAILIILSLTVSLFYYSVPQGLANCLLLALILFETSQKDVAKIKKKKIYWELAVLTAILLVHPLSAVAAIVILGAAYAGGSKRKFSILRICFYVLLSALSMLFFIAGGLSGKIDIKLAWQGLDFSGQIFKNLLSYVPFYSTYHLIYLIGYNWLVLYAAWWVSGYLAQRKKQPLLSKYQLTVLVILLFNWAGLALIKVGGVINYEQAEFFKRWAQIIILAAIPLALNGLASWLEALKKIKNGKLAGVIFLSMGLTAALYLSYPHNDAFVKARGYSVSAADLKAVKWIEKDANSAPYVVLANQSVSAAGLYEFGFKHYYRGLFYYPLPTSSPLYKIYLKMVYQGVNLNYVKQAENISGVKLVYLVINNYWLDSKKIVQQAKRAADSFKNIGNRVWIFKFKEK